MICGRGVLFGDAFPRKARSFRPSDNTFRYLINQIAAFLSEASKAFHREGGEFVAALVEGHLPRTSVVSALARHRSGGSWSVSVSAACPQVDPRLWVRIRDVEECRFMRYSDAVASRVLPPR